MIHNTKQIFFPYARGHFLTFHKIHLFSQLDESNSKSWISKLTKRSLLILHGPEAFKLLQGLTTNDINLLAPKRINSKSSQQRSKEISDRLSIYTLFLSPKGKLITDAFIYRPKVFLNGRREFRQDQLWIDVDSALKKDLCFHLKKYMWKKQVELIDVDTEEDSHKPTVYAGFNHISTISSYLDRGMEIDMPKEDYRQEEYSNMMMFDPRGGNYGRRILCMQEELGIPPKDFEYVPESKYEDFQRTIGFTHSTVTANKLPFQFNFDLLNAISFKKGCYLGQQIVSRSYFTGIVRRRVFPFIVHNQSSLSSQQVNDISSGAKLLNQANQQVAKVIFYEKGSTGLALAPYLNYFKDYQENPEQSEEDKNKQMLNIKIKTPFEGVLYCPFQKELTDYIVETQKKQKHLQELDI